MPAIPLHFSMECTVYNAVFGRCLIPPIIGPLLQNNCCVAGSGIVTKLLYIINSVFAKVLILDKMVEQTVQALSSSG